MLSIGDAAAVKTYENDGRLLVFTLGGAEVPLPRKRGVPLGPLVVDTTGVPPLDAARAAGSCTCSARVAMVRPGRPPCCQTSRA